MKDLLDSFIKKYDLKAEVLPIKRLPNLEDDFIKCLEKGFIDDDLYNLYLDGFSFNIPDEPEGVKSIIILGMARPQHRLKIEAGGKVIDAIIPPTYIDYRKIFRDMLKLLKEWFEREGYGISRALLPLKLTAVRSGLAKYGKNNISYIDKWGSFHQLLGFFTDWESGRDPWQEMKVLDACKKCKLCLKACPTGAISEERFNLFASRCLTFFNESKNSIPEWVKPEAHNSLVGCMRCQLVCPYDKKVRNWVVDMGELSLEEIAQLEKKPDSKLVKKFRDIGLYEWLGDIPVLRNIKLLAGGKM